MFTFLKFPTWFTLFCRINFFHKIMWEFWPLCFQYLHCATDRKILRLKFELNNLLLQYCRLTQVICQGFLNFWGHFKLCLQRKLMKWTKASDKRLRGKKIRISFLFLLVFTICINCFLFRKVQSYLQMKNTCFLFNKKGNSYNLFAQVCVISCLCP